MWDNVKKFTIKLYGKQDKNIKEKINADNKEYTEYIKGKKSRYNKILDYYKEYYGKQDDWWQ
jgi:hypothetical protein